MEREAHAADVGASGGGPAEEHRAAVAGFAGGGPTVAPLQSQRGEPGAAPSTTPRTCSPSSAVIRSRGDFTPHGAQARGAWGTRPQTPPAEVRRAPPEDCVDYSAGAPHPRPVPPPRDRRHTLQPQGQPQYRGRGGAEICAGALLPDTAAAAQGEPGGGAAGAADAYLNHVTGAGGGTAEAWLRATRLGGALLRVAGGVEAAATALWEARDRRGMRNLGGVHDPSLDGRVSRDLLAYLRDVEAKGFPPAASRRGVGSTRCPTSQRGRPSTRCTSRCGRTSAWDGSYSPLALPRSTCLEPRCRGQDPDRSLAKDKRVVHDQRGPNVVATRRCTRRRSNRRTAS